MTDFAQQYEQLFGEKLTFDPISPSPHSARPPTPRLDLTSSTALGLGGETAAESNFLDDYNNAMANAKPAPVQEDVGYGTALGRSLKAGLQDVGAMGLGMAEYGARQTALTHESETVRELARWGRDKLAAGRQYMQEGAAETIGSLTPEQQDMAARHIFTLDPDKTIFRANPVEVAQALGLKLARMTPPSLTTLIPGAVIARVATAPAAIAYLAASEAGMSIGGIQNQIATEIEAIPPEVLSQESPAFAQMLQSGMDPVAAKQRLIAEAQGQAPLIGGLTVAAISSLAGRYLAPVFEKGGGANIVQRFGRGYAAEAPQEAGQGAAEQLAANVAARAYDEDRAAMEGVLQAAGEEGVLGGVMGGGTSALLGRGPEPVAAPPAPPAPAVPPPASFEEVFGTGGENPLALPDAPQDPRRFRVATGGDELSGYHDSPEAANRALQIAREQLDPKSYMTEIPVPYETPRATASPQELEAAGQRSMYLPLPGEEGMQGQLPLGQAQPLRDVNRAAVTTIPGQQPLPLKRRVRGGMPQMPDAPTAEPVSDIEAQLMEMLEDNRDAVYISPEQQVDTAGIGVPLENFDGRGGKLIARDEEVAQQLIAMRNNGRPMQEIIGFATGAGTGKPVDGDTAVQRRDEAGNVLQESLVPEREADALVARWQQEFPADQVVVLTPEEVIQRRDGLISEEAQARTGDLFTGYVPPVKGPARRPMAATKQVQREAGEAAVAAKVAQATEAEGYTGDPLTAPTEARAAAKLIGRGREEAVGEKARRIGGFFEPKSLDFKDQGQRDRYASAFSKLVEDELTVTEIEREYAGKERPPDVVAAYKRAFDSRKKTREQLARIRTVSKPRRKSERPLRAAERVSPHIGKQFRNEVARQATKRVDESNATGFEDFAEEDERDIANLLPEQVEQMHGQVLDEAFYRAARVDTGKRPGKVAYTRGETAGDAKEARGDRTASDESVHEVQTITKADQIPEGSEAIVYTQKAEATGRAEAKIGSLKKVGKDRWRGVITQEGQPDTIFTTTGSKEEAEAYANGVVETHNKKLREPVERGQNLEDVLATHKSPSLKRKFINRIAAKIRRREHGGKAAALPLTRKAKQVGTVDAPRDEATAGFSTAVLTRDTTKQDESVEARVLRQARAQAARRDLSRALTQGETEMARLTEDRFADAANETGDDGLWTESASNIHYGRMYLRQVMQYGRALINSEFDASAALKEMEKVTEFIQSALNLTPTKFGELMSGLARADIRESIARKSAKGDINLQKLKAMLQDPAQREAATVEWNARVYRNMANFLRLNKAWRTDDVFSSTVEPLMRKFTASTLRDGYPSYKPTGIELESLNWALQQWVGNNERVVVEDDRGNEIDLGTREDVFYDPVRRFFTDLGYKFDDGKIQAPTPETDMLSFLPAVRKELMSQPVGAPKAAEKKGTTRFKGLDPNDAGSGVSVQVPQTELTYGERKEDGSAREVIEKTKLGRARAGQAPDRASSTIYKEFQRTQERVRFARDQGAERARIVEQETQWHQANRLIEQFRERVAHPRATIADLIRHETRLIKGFRELGIYRDTPSPAFGALTLHNTGMESKTMSLAAPRLAAKTLTKDQARKLMLQLKPFTLPAIAEGRPASEAQLIAKAVTHKAKQPIAIKETNKEGEDETVMLYQQVGVQQHGDAFLDLAVELKSMLDAGVQQGHAILDKVIAMTPAGHPYHEVAKIMRRLTSSNVPVRWGKAGGDGLRHTSLGRALFRSEGNTVVINKDGLNALNVATDAANAAAATVHVTLHELAHTATQHMLANDRQIAHEFKAMQRIARRIIMARGEPMPYGLREQDPVQEFVAEAFTNTAFQNQLDSIKMEMREQSLLKQLWNYIKGLFGAKTEDTMLDLVFAKADRVFSDQAHTIRSKAGEEAFDLEAIADPVTKTYIRDGMNRIVESGRMRRIIAQGKWAGVRAPLSLMTLGQIRNEFKARVDGLDEYYRAFKNRDARNSEHLERAERLSRQWTKLTEKDGAAVATQFSEIATLATVHDVHPDKPLSDKANEHVKLDEQKAHHKELKREFDSLPAAWKEHYADLKKYYQEVLHRESVLLTQNALRATLTKSKNPPMLPERFESTYTYDKVASLSTEQALRAEFEKYLDDDMLKTVTAMRTLPSKRTGPYFPIMRYGEYVVEGKTVRETKSFPSYKEAQSYQARLLADDPTLIVEITKLDDGSAKVKVTERAFLLAENATDAQIKREELLEDYEHVSAVTKKLEYATESTIRSNEALGRILDNLEGNAAAQAAMRQYYLRTLSDSSFRKHEIKRKMRRGYDTKLQHRNFTNYAQAASYYTAQLEYGWKMSQAMSRMVKSKDNVEGESREGVRVSEVVENLQRRDKLSADPTAVNDLVRKGVSFAQFTMLTSPSYWMLNATQPYMVSLPYMAAKHSLGAVVGAMGHAQKLIIHPLVGQAWNSKAGLAAFWSKTKTEEAFNVLDDVKASIMNKMKAAGKEAEGKQILDMLDALRRESILDLSWIAELRDIAEGRDTGVWQKTLDASRVMSHLTEVNNRILTAVAAYNLAKQKGSHEQAVEYAKDVVQQTHFDYSSGNKPLLFRPDGPLGAAAPLVFQFMQWPQHMYAMLISNMVKVFRAKGVERAEAAKIIGGLLGTHMMAGGIIGASLQPIKWAIGFAMMALGDDDEPYTFTNAMSGATFDRLVQEGASTIAGPAVGELLARGVPAKLGTDLSDRMSLGTLYHMDLRTNTTESTLGSLVSSVGGPWLSIGENGIRAMGDIANGDVARGVERVAPKVVRDMFKTYRYATEGVVNNARDTVIDSSGIPPTQLFLQSLGFGAAEVDKFYNRQAVIKDKERYGADRRDTLVARYVSARTAEDRKEALREVMEFNRAFPAARVTQSTLLRSVQSSRERERSYRRYGANLRDDQRAYADEGWYFE